MSMVICEHCDAPIDSDEDPYCFVEVGNMRRQIFTEIICENCRERMGEAYEADMNRADAHEQYVSAWHEKQRLS